MPSHIERELQASKTSSTNRVKRNKSHCQEEKGRKDGGNGESGGKQDTVDVVAAEMKSMDEKWCKTCNGWASNFEKEGGGAAGNSCGN